MKKKNLKRLVFDKITISRCNQNRIKGGFGTQHCNSATCPVDTSDKPECLVTGYYQGCDVTGDCQNTVPCDILTLGC